jgi:predicted peptidase
VRKPCGASGVLTIAADYPERWAAILPVSAFVREGFLNFGAIPCWCIHGEKDTAAPAAAIHEMVRQLRGRGISAWYTEIPGREHSIWDVYHRRELYEWMLAQRRGVAAVPPGRIGGREPARKL